MHVTRGSLGAISFYDYTADLPGGAGAFSFRLAAENQADADADARTKAAERGATLRLGGAAQQVTAAPEGTTPSVYRPPSVDSVMDATQTQQAAPAVQLAGFGGKVGLLLAAGLAFALLRRKR